jgi:hypothetical protein
VFILFSLMDEPGKLPIDGSLVWVTPAGAQNNQTQGIGVLFSEDESARYARRKIETILRLSCRSPDPHHIALFLDAADSHAPDFRSNRLIVPIHDEHAAAVLVSAWGYPVSWPGRGSKLFARGCPSGTTDCAEPDVATSNPPRINRRVPGNKNRSDYWHKDRPEWHMNASGLSVPPAFASH